MHILITNFHSIENKGDLGIVMGLMAGIRAHTPGASFAVIGRREEERSWWAAQGVSFHTPLLSHPRHRDGAYVLNRFRALHFFLSYHVSLWCLRVPRLARFYYRSSSLQETLAAYVRADVVISKGGSFFREPEYRLNLLPVGIFSHLHQIRAALVLKKKVILAGQSFGPLRNPCSRYAVRKAFRQCALITTREESATAFLQELGVTKNVVSAGDTAFLLTPVPGLTEGRTVGMTVRSWSNTREYETYLRAVTALIERFVADGFHFFLMPQVTGPSLIEDDRRVSREVAARVSPEARAKVTVVEEPLELPQLLERYGVMEYFIATRLHSGIFALLESVPTLVIAYEPKAFGVFGDVGLRDHVLDIRSITGESLANAFARLLDTNPAVFASARSRALQKAEQNIQAINEVIQSVA